MRISQLEEVASGGGRIALWGWGREGRASYRAIRARWPHLSLTLLCTADEVADAMALGDPRLAVDAASPGPLATFALVVKSPGLSPYLPEARAAAEQGTRFIGGTGLWFAQRAEPGAVATGTVCVTGTKGKSTSTALLAHLLRSGGHLTALAGNIGLPLLELADAPAPEFFAIELSSYQTGDVARSGVRPDIAVVTNVFPEHLDWHGSEARYVEDKLQLLNLARPRVAVINAADARLASLALPDSEVRWFGREDGWHLRGDVLHRADERVMDTLGLPLPGRHNRSNLCAVLTAIEALGLDAASLASHAGSFRPLPHRLQTLGSRDGITYVNDSISTTPHASLAALECFSDRRVALIAGGHDRGLDWSDFVAALADRAPAAVVTVGQNGPRIHRMLSPLADRALLQLADAADLDEAVARASDFVRGDGVVLMSPGAPSFGPYRDYVERGRHFASLSGFDPDAISSIQGLGIG